MASVHDFLAHAILHHGHPYGTIGRFGPIYYDCSGHVWAALRDVGLGGFPQSSATQFRACREISLSQAVRTPGALIFMPQNPNMGVGPLGHVAISLGNGYTSEARGHAYGVGSWPIAGRGFSTRAGLIPGINYSNAAVPNIGEIVKGAAYVTLLRIAQGPTLGVADLKNVEAVGDEVRYWQDALNLTMHSGLKVDGNYGGKTASATGTFQNAYNKLAGYLAVPAFGVVEDKTRAAMVKALTNLINTI